METAPVVRIRSSRKSISGPARNSRHRTDRRRPSLAPLLQRLEERAIPATITVTSPADSGPGTLREAILQAEMTPDRDTITFAPSVRGTITLDGALPDLTGPIDLEGPGASALMVARNAAEGTTEFRIFIV